MPIYEYHCTACKKDHEIIQKMNDAPLKICPACGEKVERKMSLGGFQLKGGGWYKDGYTSSSSKGTSKPEPKVDKPKK
ncbi:MAG: zinc ribbon domain-containing protein [Deltaproteobacteria bacterium]|nr:zinc ribbon domain-containing protein [Deltaproteobacteria bacterium]